MPFLILGVPIFDICFAVLRRVAHGQNPMHADRGHIHHRLIDMGFSQKQSVAIAYMLTAILGLAAVLLTSSGELKALILIGAVFVVSMIGFRLIFSNRKSPRRMPSRNRSPQTQNRPRSRNRPQILNRQKRRRRMRPRRNHMEKIKVMSVFGTRPEAIKMAPLVKALEACDAIESRVCLTGQHREMLDSVMQIFHLHGDFDLDIMEQRQTLSTITYKTLLGMERVFEQDKPDLILVHGDTSTTFAGAWPRSTIRSRSAMWRRVLRTWDKYSPVPGGDEPHARRRHCRPALLADEGQRRKPQAREHHGRCFITGNTAIDAMRYTVRPDYKFSTAILNELDFAHHRVLAVTCHRRENYGEPMQNIMHAILRLVEENPDVEVVYPVHLSPVVRECAFPILGAIRASTSSIRSTSRRCTT